ncbi:MAG: hypothetical protein ACOYT8_01490 [Candidatus Dependentiae bacterium]
MHLWYSRIYILLCLIPLAGCGPRYKRTQLAPLSNKNAEYVSTKSNVTVRAVKLPKSAIKNLFDGRGVKITRYPISVIQLSLSNYHNIPLFLTTQQVGLVLLSDKSIKDICFDSKSGYILKDCFKGLGIATMVTAMSCAPLAFGVIPIGYYCALAGGCVAAGTVVATPLVSFFQTKKNVCLSNQLLNADINQTLLFDSFMIPSCQTRQCLLFVLQKDYKPKFAITLTDQHNKEIQTFTIKLP